MGTSGGGVRIGVTGAVAAGWVFVGAGATGAGVVAATVGGSGSRAGA